MYKIIKILLIIPIKIYQYALSGLLGTSCRFHPICSTYAIEAIENIPLHKAFFYILLRIIRCHPFNKGGNDPIPPQYKK